MISQPFGKCLDCIQVCLNRPGGASFVAHFSDVLVYPVCINVGSGFEARKFNNPTNETHSAFNVFSRPVRRPQFALVIAKVFVYRSL